MGDATRFVSGYFSCDRWASEVILAGLPSMLTVSVRDGDRRGWLEDAIQFLVAEAASDHAGRGALLTKLSEALFVETLRRWMTGLQHRWQAGDESSSCAGLSRISRPLAKAPADRPTSKAVTNVATTPVWSITFTRFAAASSTHGLGGIPIVRANNGQRSDERSIAR